jgi:DNA polymerase-1
VHIWEEWEADDMVVALIRDNPNKYILAAVDKDVLYSIPGRHFNYYSSERYNIDMKWVEVDKDTAMKHHFVQALTGDTADNIPGLQGVGPKTADKILNGIVGPRELWDKVKAEYEARGKTAIDALTTMRLVHMHQVVLDKSGQYTVVLWNPSTSSTSNSANSANSN